MRDGKSRSLGKDFSTCPSRVVLALLQDLLLGEHHDLLLLGEHHLDELLVVDVPLRVLLPVNQLLHLLLGHLLSEAGQQMAQLNRRDSEILLKYIFFLRVLVFF